MEISGKKILILGGWGLVGNAICKELLKYSPAKLFISSLRQVEAEEAVSNLRKEFQNFDPNTFEARWGNIFAQKDWKDTDWNEILSDPVKRRTAISNIYDDLTEDVLKNSALYSLISETKPDIVIDCINTATAIAYQDIYRSVNLVRRELITGNLSAELVERMVASSYIPQLIRHVQIMYRSLVDFNVKMYLKIGTSGTGGMGLNIPYTHSEERPSRVLLAKSAVAGAQTLLLFLMARTPNGPKVKEIKPTAAIAWKRIAYGNVIRKGKPIQLVDMTINNARPIDKNFEFNDFSDIQTFDDYFKSVFIDTGENGIFSRAEFEAISSIGQMEIVTPEEIASYAIFEILGGNTGKDIIQGLDAFTLGSTYRGGVMQEFAISKLRQLEFEHETESISFELLGPPRLSKLLYEANILKKIATSMKNVLSESAEKLSDKSLQLITNDVKLRRQILSIGLVILLPDGKKYLRGKEVKIPVNNGENALNITKENIEKWCNEGWIDLRAKNFEKWQTRFRTIIEQVQKIPETETSSCFNYNAQYWNNFEDIDEGKLVGWIFEFEDQGWRFKR